VTPEKLCIILQLEKLHQFLHGAHLVCDHDNSSATFHKACHLVQDLINMIKNDKNDIKMT
jgi:hypothetical protein